MPIEQLAATERYATFFSIAGVGCYVSRFVDLANALPNPEQFLSHKERERQSTYVQQNDRERYALSHAFLRCVIAQTLHPEFDGDALQMQALALCLTETKLGKPILDQFAVHTNLTFSLSRSRTATAICLGWNVAVGIDVESLEQQRHMTPALLTYAFSPAEQRHLADHALPEEAALKLWTRKEAILKADGRGLRIAPALVESLLELEQPSALPHELGDPSGWGVYTRLTGQEVVSLAIRRW